MLSLTKQEKTVVIFLAAIFLSGLTLHYLLKLSPSFADTLSFIDSEKIYPKCDVNKASYEELVKIPYIGPATAKRIIDYRKANGPFRDVDELKSVAGFGERKFQSVIKYIKVRPARRPSG